MRTIQNIFKTLSMIAVVLLLSQVATAQKTGSYDTSISFMSQPRTLSVYVPANYSASNSYRLMVCLHGLGDNSTNYRDALINSLSWNTNFSSTIFVCPDGGIDPNSDFYTPVGDEAIVQEAINYAKASYNIDASNIILQGFSLGGRSAFKYGTEHANDFKGLLLNTPAIQGVKDAVKPVTEGGLNYAAAKQLPVYITHGGQDILYTAPIDSFYRNLVLNDYKVKLVRIASLAHVVPAFSNTPGLNTYFDSPVTAGLDAEMVEVMMPPYTCDPQVQPQVLIRNARSTAITSVYFQYTVGGNVNNYTWNGNLLPYEHAVITLPATATANGNNAVQIDIMAVNGQPDNTTNNGGTTSFVKETSGKALPVNEGFEGSFPPSGWTVKASGDVYSAWTDDDQVKKTGSKSMTAFNTIILFDNAGRREEIYSPMLDLSSISNPVITFDIAYNYHKYTQAVWGIDSTFADTLEVLISTDCGDHFTSLYKKGGAQLATFTNPITDPTSITGSFIAPKAENWSGVGISMGNYAQEKNAMIAFRYISALGGSINIDNISFTSKELKVDAPVMAKTKLYPNPAASSVQITADAPLLEITVTDLTGKQLMNVDAANSTELSINTGALTDGLYLFHIRTAAGSSVEKVMIKR